ncbi:hypothetical protein ABH945_007210 [Paraburkholderia sp. GAS333]|uniref:hypothetical protein n=1 Tax=Paraburkholderia sp. GAS333 TaxID=3156279 RepID=UPI003D1DA64A
MMPIQFRASGCVFGRNLVTLFGFDTGKSQQDSAYKQRKTNEHDHEYNLATERIRGFYTALTNNNVTSLPEWKGFKESAERRNHIAHKGKIVQQKEAEETLAVTTALVKHLGFV